MSRLQHLIDQLNDTTRSMSQLTENVTTEDEIGQINLSSVKKRRDDLARRIDEELALTQNSMVQYRIERTDRGVYPAKAVGEALETFQDLVTAVYDALVHGPKRRFRPSVDSISKTTFNFAGATAGSVKITLAAEDDRMLLGDTTFERALALVEKTLSAQTTDDLSALASEVGIAAVSRAYEWAKSAASYDLKTEIAWGKMLAPERTFEIRPDDAARVTQLIEHKSDSISSRHSYLCVLHGFDKQTSYFHIETLDERAHIKGDVDQLVSQIHTTGRRYKASLLQTITTFYATGEDKEHWTLEELAPLEDDSSIALT